ncbi:BZ3500_MvSof-1268-A1-R1_Chr1-2g01432 [Microbotryum saponariae]|uniref:BZ3500_MvSof-1268-A1-R1_Chr1-2g01432 protein n=1 Tax=Microbotryum saponariae TaxID=289078 RepID=A0A2X0KTF5_9BASI|nr:BZ3500_MvSof-1268-A1-R1_Chr1-2g01432 [Microbotryum saponariae]SCZ97419.1 BZ3501_MvSof-1269-A2-R1_Chr1-2g01031 [Microbotryum saponariae]
MLDDGMKHQGTFAIAFCRSLRTPGQIVYASLIKADFWRDLLKVGDGIAGIQPYDEIAYRSADEVVELVKRPASHLRLEEGIPVILRNLDTDAGLCNGNRRFVSHAILRVI